MSTDALAELLRQFDVSTEVSDAWTFDEQAQWLAARGVVVLPPAVAEVAARVQQLEDLLAHHRRFHAKVGCPGDQACYVCQAETTTQRST